MSHRRLRTYQRRRGPGVFTFVLLGIILGMGYLLFDNWRGSPSPASSLPPATPVLLSTPSIIPTVFAPTVAAFLPAVAPPPPASLVIPSVGVSASVIDIYLDGESWDVSQLGINVGHLQGTARIGERGNIALTGHVDLRDGRTGAFARLEQIAPGDSVMLQQTGLQLRYTVADIRIVEPDDLSVLYPTSDDRLTLVTCTDYDFLQNVYLKRVIVVAERVV